MYVGMNSPHDDKRRLRAHDGQHAPGRSNSASHALTVESSITSPPPPLVEPPPRHSAHGGARDDELDQFRGASALTQTALYHFNSNKPQRVGSAHGGHSMSSFAGDDVVVHGSSMGVDGMLQRMTSDTTATPPASVHGGALDKKRSFYAQARGHLLGAEPSVPRWCLGATFRGNSFFAWRLLGVAVPLGCVMAAGLGVYYLYKPRSLQLNPAEAPTSYGFMLADPRAVYTFQASPCENMVGFSALIYHALPAVVLLALPASGLRAFEPFKREDSPTDADSADADASRKKIKRTLVFQACELVAVLVFAFALVTLLFFAYMFFNGGAFSCSAARVQLFAAIALLCFGALFVELVYFARFREHVKMLLGAFKESDQTGDVRHHVVDPGLDHVLDQHKQLVAAVRKQLYNAARLGDERALRDVLARASALAGFPARYYRAPRLYVGLFGLSRKNPVHVAAAAGNVAVLAQLHGAGFDVTARDKFSRVRFSTGDLFWYFARYVVAKPVVSDEDNAVSIFRTTLVTPLHCAVAHGQLDAVRWLLAHGADADAPAQSSYRSERVPPLFLAEHPEIVRALLQHGADQLAIPDPGFMNTLTALQLAYLRGNFAVAQELEDWGGDVALTPFHAAAARNDTAVVRKFIRARTPIDCLGEHGYVGLNRRTPLHWAAVNGATAVVELLLEAGADPNFQDARGRTPLHWAARLNRLEIVQCLLAKGARASLADLDQLTPVVCAAYARDTSRELIAALVAAGADVNYALPSNGDTALHVAVREEQEASALALLAAGGNIMKMNADGLRPLDCTTSTRLLFAVKRAAGQRDVMISYTHSHAEFAKKLRKSLEDASVTTWLDLMDPSGIGGGAVWREEIARGITHAALVVCILTEDYAASEWCLKELALAKQVGTPILAVSTEGVRIGEDLQVYLYTRQVVPFEPAITRTLRNATNARQIEYEYDERRFQAQFRLLLDGVRDEIEKRRAAAVQQNQQHRALANATALAVANGGGATGFSRLFAPWDAARAGAAPFVFVSHGDKHATFVQQLCEALARAGVSCFGDRSVGDGQSFESRIHAAQEAILQCAAFVVVLSSETAGSELVRDQLAFAEDKGRPIFPVVLNDLAVALDQQYSLSRNELFHFLRSGMGFQASFDQLLGGIRRHYRTDDDGSFVLGVDGTSGSVVGTNMAAGITSGTSDPTTTGATASAFSAGVMRAATANNTVTSFVSLDMESYDSDESEQVHGLAASDDMAFASFNFGGPGGGSGAGMNSAAAMPAVGTGTGGARLNAYTSATAIAEDAEVYGSAPGVPLTPSSMAETQPSDTRNFESLSSIEDGKVDLSSMRVRM